MLYDRPLLIIIRAEIEPEVGAQQSSMQKVREVIGPIRKPGCPRHRINLNNPLSKKKIQAILSKVTGPNNDTGKR